MTVPKPKLQSVLQHPAIWRAVDTGRAAECRGQDQIGISTGYEGLDQVLPGGGWPDSGMAEVLCPHWGCGEAELLAPMLQQQSRQSRWLVWINPPWIPYAPALAQQGIVLENTLFLRCDSDKDVLWAMEQSLASGSCSVVQGWPAKPQPQHIRRLQLAAQKGHSLGVLLRPSACNQQPSPAPLRLELGPLQQALQVRVVKCRGSWGTDWLRLKPVTVPEPLVPVPGPSPRTGLAPTVATIPVRPSTLIPPRASDNFVPGTPYPAGG